MTPTNSTRVIGTASALSVEMDVSYTNLMRQLELIYLNPNHFEGCSGHLLYYKLVEYTGQVLNLTDFGRATLATYLMIRNHSP